MQQHWLWALSRLATRLCESVFCDLLLFGGHFPADALPQRPDATDLEQLGKGTAMLIYCGAEQRQPSVYPVLGAEEPLTRPQAAVDAAPGMVGSESMTH